MSKDPKPGLGPLPSPTTKLRNLRIPRSLDGLKIKDCAERITLCARCIRISAEHKSWARCFDNPVGPKDKRRS